MPQTPQRRSPRRPLELPIRIFGTDFQGRDFVEDSSTVVVNRHGAKIRLTRGLIPEQEIRIVCQDTRREGLFRVVERAGEPAKDLYFWGVECLDPSRDFWEGGVPLSTSVTYSPRQSGLAPAPPPRRPGAHARARAGAGAPPASAHQSTFRCPECGMREVVELDAAKIQAVMRLKGLVRACPACGATRLWKPIGALGS